ncbi:hypothetical protein M2158_001203 [Streptomyces sp. SAI-144]|jgi:hypothetical protein|nr:hypothetical protein [Streptomyces sp. SAI-144]MDH6491904.1 hypothetical protein [Streptomyces sp. SAI-127]
MHRHCLSRTALSSSVWHVKYGFRSKIALSGLDHQPK